MNQSNQDAYFLSSTTINGISTRRIRNLLKKYDWIHWDCKTVCKTDNGLYGDKPAWSIKGSYKNLNITWTSATPNGTNAKLEFEYRKTLNGCLNKSLQNKNKIDQTIIKNGEI